MSHNTIPSAQPPARRNQLDVLEDIAESTATLAAGGGGSGGPDRELLIETYRANKNFTGATTGDLITATRMIDVSGANPVQVGATAWFNESTQLALAGAPLTADIDLAGGGGGITNAEMIAALNTQTTSINGTVLTNAQEVAALATQTTSLKDGTLATGAKQDAGNTSLATIATNTTGAATDANLTAQVGVKLTAAPALGAGGSGLIGWLSNLFQSFFGVANNAADSGNPIKVGGKYNASVPTITDQSRADFQVNRGGALIVALDPSAAFAADALSNNSAVISRGRGNVDYMTVHGMSVYNGSTWDRARGDTTGVAVNVLKQPTVSRVIAVTSASAPLQLTAAVKRISIYARGADMRYRLGNASPTAVATDHFIAQGERLDLNCEVGATPWIAAIRDGATDGNLQISELS